ncbi:hypothetical protein BDV29DRAFT_161553 [Aspergillus leporis]|uniref:Uncharacterized protein n=1 Tax=Aspergillus leporis TaxID=41062 RepID=A0A5N5WL73_9EURO|nr:hypothetical protein BDV29DRAFT_161553 [Aspergillus leporis]
MGDEYPSAAAIIGNDISAIQSRETPPNVRFYVDWADDESSSIFTIADKQILKLPVGSWPKDERLKECGSLMRVNLIEGVDALQLPF